MSRPDTQTLSSATYQPRPEDVDVMGKRSFGRIHQLPSKRYRARYTGPDTRVHNAPHTFDTKLDAEAWLTDERRLISAGTWSSPRSTRHRRAAGGSGPAEQPFRQLRLVMAWWKARPAPLDPHRVHLQPASTFDPRTR